MLEALVDRSLVLFDNDTGRFRLLDTVRDYAREKGAVEGSIVQARHARYFAANTENLKPRLQSKHVRSALQSLAEDEANVRAALDLECESPDDVETALRLCSAMALYWHMRGQFQEGRDRCSRALEVALQNTDAVLPAVLVSALTAAGNLAFAHGDYLRAAEYHESALPIREAIGDRDGLAMTLHNLAIAQTEMGDLASSEVLEERALRLNREVGNRVREASNLNSLAMIAALRGDDDRARALYEETCEIATELGDSWTRMLALLNLAELQLRHGETAEARSRLIACLELCGQMDAWPSAALACELLSRLELATGRPEEAAFAFGAGDAIRAHIDLPRSPAEKSSLQNIRSALTAAGASAASALRRASASDARSALAQAIREAESGIGR